MYKYNVSLSIAPPIINIAPIVCTNVSFSSKSITENITAESGSIYPHTETVVAESFCIDEK